MNEPIRQPATTRSIACVLGFVLTLGIASAAHGQDLRIVVLSVGQTDSQLIISPTGRTLLIDCGAEVAGRKTQYEYVAQRLEELTGGRRVDYFLIIVIQSPAQIAVQ